MMADQLPPLRTSKLEKGFTRHPEALKRPKDCHADLEFSDVNPNKMAEFHKFTPFKMLSKVWTAR
jgi:hypothetical protein